MILYEVNLAVDRAIAEDYAAWLGPHIAGLLALDGFLSAEWFEADSDDERVHWCVQYRLRDRAALDTYVATHAERLRGDGLARFGGRFTATRRILARQSAFGAGR